MSLEHVRDGIERYTDPDGFHEPTCGRCGGSTDWIDCDQCTDGLTHHDCGEDSCACLHPVNNVLCDVCRGAGSRYVCMNSREWCEDHPLPDRGHIETTAMSADAWRDVL